MTGQEVLASVLLLGGALLAVLAALGLLRLPDVGARLQAATLLQLPGLVALVAGAAVLVPTADSWKLVLVVAFQAVTAPVLSHLIGRAAHRAGVGEPLVRDELGARGDRSGEEA
ncbi:monovalent cation/H(+) antiporter subunit G [Geodermatophilus sp. DSM 44513]|uniref:monovalent cation/H(+) antiporter subunit G n=1 Tax=Geodermatophilus sp. DSM 44513 TaxID=1528104 RepID=UPI001271B63A|nr:monovalent cation/H(+) antiporter subunit G [Geodermatophilus sp. DSM 44513]WNV73743.1 monovalent cation/H(+) antiporter subunit G [Geodermatophilus sp. DSM 44513]